MTHFPIGYKTHEDSTYIPALAYTYPTHTYTYSVHTYIHIHTVSFYHSMRQTYILKWHTLLAHTYNWAYIARHDIHIDTYIHTYIHTDTYGLIHKHTDTYTLIGIHTDIQVAYKLSGLATSYTCNNYNNCNKPNLSSQLQQHSSYSSIAATTSLLRRLRSIQQHENQGEVRASWHWPSPIVASTNPSDGEEWTKRQARKANCSWLFRLRIVRMVFTCFYRTLKFLFVLSANRECREV